MQTTTTSKRFSLGVNDWIKGLLMAVIGAVVGYLYGVITSGDWDWNIDWGAVGKAALIAAISYLVKNFGDKPKVVITDVPKETIDAVKNGDATVKVINQ